MIYLDTNILIYAFCKNVDNIEQKRVSQEILKETVSKERLLLSEIILYKFAFVSKKVGELPSVIQANLEYLSKYVRYANIYSKVIELMCKIDSYKHSFDSYHIEFSNFFNCSELITFDNEFKQFYKYSRTKIKIL